MRVLHASVGDYLGLIIGAVLAIAWLVIKHYLDAKRAAERLEFLTNKYGDPAVAKNIVDKILWLGESDEQLLESMGRPGAIDQKVLKTKLKEVWKYGHAGANRYRLRVTVEDGIVVGWEMKN